MPIRPKNKRSLNSDIELNSSELARAGIFTVDSYGLVENYDQYASFFLLNPSTYEDTKTANWAEHSIPGQSDPVYQWMAGGPRIVSFEALVTNDTSVFKFDHIKSDERRKNLGTQVVSTLASALFGVNNLSKGQKPKSPKSSKTGTLDISGHLNYYRSLLYPKYNEGNNPGRLQQSPPLIVLYVGSAINIEPVAASVSPDSDVWILTDLRIRVTKQLSNLAPMEAIVNFKLVQYTTKPFDRLRFHRVS